VRAAAMGEAGRRRAAEHFGEARSIDRVELLYRAYLAKTAD
jgi:hypothetical protein